jgi:hypothetical protein
MPFVCPKPFLVLKKNVLLSVFGKCDDENSFLDEHLSYFSNIMIAYQHKINKTLYDFVFKGHET